ncbi:MAG: DUF3990 domain-containing protein [Lentisphaeria bacterium]|nr:DUF3990 domain-containing protein [Lentisphaeria bacterium]
MRVYHGSIMVVEHPLVHVGRRGLDFGLGFYVTEIRRQAVSWADRMARVSNVHGIVNSYELNMEKVQREFSCKTFPEYDEQWLQFIVENRLGMDNGMAYDLVEGGVADDRVIDTVEAYLAGMMPLEIALRNLAMHRPNKQICIRNQRIVDTCVEFAGSQEI